MILVCGSQVPAYGIRPMHDPINVPDMHGTGTKHIFCQSQMSFIQRSGVAEFTCCTVEPISFGRSSIL